MSTLIPLATIAIIFLCYAYGWKKGMESEREQIVDEAVERGYAQWSGPTGSTWDWIEEDDNPHPHWDSMTESQKDEAIRKAV